MSERHAPVALQLLGKEYRVACAEPEREKLQAAAALLEQQLQAIRATGKVLATENVVMQAAINLAVLLLEERHLREQQAKVTKFKLHKLYYKLDRAICTPTQDML
jgi:cell division protein ZapA